MQCEACGEVNTGTARFCQGCGALLARTCLVCGNASELSAVYCGACGTRLAESLASPDPLAAHPPPLARNELKQVTVLFVDLVSSTEMIALLDPETAMQRLSPVLQTMCDIVERFGGTVLRTLGDGIMALFGAPRAQEGHAVLACQAALAIRDAMHAGPGGHSVRGGLHSGEVVANAPLPGQGKYSDAYGMALHLGSRLPAQVEAGRICITEPCYRLVRSFCEVRSLGLRTLRGVPAQMALYQLVGIKPDAARQPFSREGLTPFLGRQNELTMLKSALQAAIVGVGCVIGITGPPGVGKSRLCHEFSGFSRDRLIPTFEARAQPYGAAVPLRPIVELLRAAYFGLAPDEVSPQAAAVIAERLAEVGVKAPADIALVCGFLGVSWQADSPSWLSPKARIARLMEIGGRLVRQRGTTTTVLILEDLHWLDEGSEAFVAALAKAVAGTRTVLIANCRPSYDASWMRTPNYQQIELSELNLSDTNRLVHELVGPHPDLADIRQRIISRSGGNPFFAEELVRSLFDEGVLTGRIGAYQLGKSAIADTLPATVQSVIGARVDRLPHADRALLQIAAIIGKDFDLAVLRSLAGQEAPALEATLDRLCAAGLLRGGDALGGLGYRFQHPLIQEVVYATQLKARRSALHAAVARSIERLHVDDRDEFAGLIAYHLEEAGESCEAAFYAARAARWIGLTSSAGAIRNWRKVRTLMVGQSRSRANDALRIEASGQIAWLGWREGLTPQQAQPFVQEALAWAREIDHSMVPLLMLVDGRTAQVNGGDSDLFLQQVRRAIALAEERGDAGRVALLQASLSHAYGWAGLLREALVANDAALAGIQHITDADQQFLGYSVKDWSVSLRGRILLRLGQFDAARACFDQMIAANRPIDPTVLFIAHYGYVDLAWCLGDVAMAAHHAARVAELAERHGSPYLHLYRLASGAIADGIAGDFHRAIRGVAESLEYQGQTGAAVEYEPDLLASLADYLMRVGAHAQAVKAGEDAIAVALRHKARLPECRAKITLASLALLANGIAARDKASTVLAEAEQLIVETGAAIYRQRLKEVHKLMSDHAGTSGPEA